MNIPRENSSNTHLLHDVSTRTIFLSDIYRAVRFIHRILKKREMLELRCS